MTRSGPARALHAAVLVVSGTGIGIELARALTDDPGPAGSTLERVVRLFSYFTILSNLLVAVVAALLVLDPRRDGRVFRVARLDGVVCITVTGLVYVTVLRGVADLTTAGQVSNALLHYVCPPLCVLVWLLTGPRPRIDARTLAWTPVAPLAWVAYTFVRGAVVGWYPYPFLDVTLHGYTGALTATLVVALLLLALAALAGFVDRKLPPRPGDAA
ncbi:hypothetical protein GCM10025864_43640 [Luteimicrobium album]|uniref:Integral membrane protein n=1 Tax=Luteimicrobium album TaxID=1054550 RepID=A0ABQ6I751_9MICO|nr:Pr6Pr family membrane protein [Luteimicrobium album]GMA26605.1 hypothetical protein GCM10025864_43640 [Luteimicrobium album]